jgi:hypothetical protein
MQKIIHVFVCHGSDRDSKAIYFLGYICVHGSCTMKWEPIKIDGVPMNDPFSLHTGRHALRASMQGHAGTSLTDLGGLVWRRRAPRGRP